MKNLWMVGMMAATLTVACKKKGCTDPAALNYNPKAEKKDFTCKYKMGAYRDSFLGYYQVMDSMHVAGNFSEGKTYELHVTTGETTLDTIFLNNLYGSGQSYMAIITGSNSFSIPSQQVDATHTLSGSGHCSSGKIILSTHSADTINGDISHRIEGSK